MEMDSDIVSVLCCSMIVPFPDPFSFLCYKMGLFQQNIPSFYKMEVKTGSGNETSPIMCFQGKCPILKSSIGCGDCFWMTLDRLQKLLESKGSLSWRRMGVSLINYPRPLPSFMV